MDKIIMILLLIIFICMIACMFCVYKIYDRHIGLKTMMFYEQIDFDSKHSILQKIIDDEMEQYLVRKVDNSNLTGEDKFMREKDIKEMINKITASVYLRITPTIRYNLSLIYDVSEEDKLMNVIGTRVSLETLGYSVEINKDIED